MNNKIDWVACEAIVQSLVQKYLTDGVDKKDLEQEARLAILESYDLYSPEMGISLQTFLGRRIRDAIRTYIGRNVDTIEISRRWVAESIADGPARTLEASTKAECEELRQKFGADKFRKPRRVIETVSATVSLDETRDSEDGEGTTLHEQVGTGPEQEWLLELQETERRTKALEAKKLKPRTTTGAPRKNNIAGIYEYVALRRAEGFTFPQIAEQLGKSVASVKMAFRRGAKEVKVA